MRVGLIGRMHWLLDTAKLVIERDHEISFIATANASPESRASVEDFADLAERHGARFSSNASISGLDLDADICLSVNWVSLLRQPFLDRFPEGIFNAHPGDLPRYRGNACPNWAIINGEQRVGLSVHKMIEELDAGPIALKRFREIGDEDITSLYRWLDDTIPDSLCAVLDSVSNGTLELTPQDPSIRPLRTYPRKAHDSVINWRGSAEQIVRVVRASSRPFGGATTRTETGDLIVVYRARVFSPDHDFLAIPGQVCFSSEGNPVIAAGDGMVELLELADDARTKQAILASLRNRLM